MDSNPIPDNEDGFRGSDVLRVERVDGDSSLRLISGSDNIVVRRCSSSPCSRSWQLCCLRLEEAAARKTQT